MQVWRGAASRSAGYRWNNQIDLLLPGSEELDLFLNYLKSSKLFCILLLTGK